MSRVAAVYLCSMLLSAGCGEPLAPDTARLEPVVSGARAVDVHGYLREAQQEGRFAGAVLLAREGKVTLAHGYGLADVEARRAITPNTVFDIGSLAKQFTAAGVLKLVEEGRLAVEDPISRYLPDVPADKRAITIHHLLTHGSGIPEFIPGPTSDFDPLGRDELVAGAMSTPLLFEPGTGHQYSNAGYSLLAAILETVTGRSYEEYLHATFFEPLRMRHTGLVIPDFKPAQLARGYEPDGSDIGTLLEYPLAPDGPYWVVRGNGAMLSTVGDLQVWFTALREGRVLSPELVARMFTPHAGEEVGAPIPYGYGWGITHGDFGPVVGHDGYGLTFADLRYYEDEGLLAILMSNQPQTSRRTWENALRVAHGAQPIDFLDLPLDAAQRARYEGSYAVGPFTIRIYSEGETLQAEIVDQGVSRLMYQGDDTFVAEADPTVRFVFAGQGERATELTVHIGGETMTGSRVE